MDIEMKIRNKINSLMTNSNDLKRDLENYNNYNQKIIFVKDSIMDKITQEAKNHYINVNIQDIHNKIIMVKIINNNSTNQNFSKFLNKLNKRGLEMINIFSDDNHNLIMNLGVKQ